MSGAIRQKFFCMSYASDHVFSTDVRDGHVMGTAATGLPKLEEKLEVTYSSALQVWVSSQNMRKTTMETVNCTCKESDTLQGWFARLSGGF